jgi:phospholipase/lecithinase/hemolysin
MGDSLSDTGAALGASNMILNSPDLNNVKPLLFFFGINQVAHEISLGDQPYYKKRSFTDGEVAIEVLARKLDKKITPAFNLSHLEYKIPFLDFIPPIKFSEIRKKGNNYAIIGAKAAMGSSKLDQYLLNYISLEKQVDALLKDHQTEIKSKDDVFILMIGSNDIIFAENFTNIYDAVTGIHNALLRLYNSGARNFMVFNAPDPSKTPQFANDNIKKIEVANFTEYFNSELDKKLKKFMSNHSDAKVIDVNLHKIFQDLLSDAKAKGMNISEACISNIVNQNYAQKDIIDIVKSGKLSSSYNIGCSEDNMKKYFYFDSLHPTKWVNEELGNKMYEMIGSVAEIN